MSNNATINPDNISVPRTQLYIAGDFVDSASGETIDVVSPVTGKVIGAVAVPGQEDLDRAVRAAREAQEKWRRVLRGRRRYSNRVGSHWRTTHTHKHE